MELASKRPLFLSGPLLLFFSLSIGHTFSKESLPLFWLTPFFFWMVVKNPKRGVVFSFIILFLFALKPAWSKDWWQLGLVLSLFLSFWIIASILQEMYEKLVLLQEEQSRGISHLEKELGEKKIQIASLQEEAVSLKYHIETMQNQKQKGPVVVPMVEQREKDLNDLRKMEASYVQLRKQFEEKNEILHITRTDHFLTETKFFSLIKENELREKEDLQELSLLTTEYTILADEREYLLEVIQELESRGQNR